MEGSYGPPHTMLHAVAAWAPNTPWAHWAAPGQSQNYIDLDGGGTSAATPQVAAACALYCAKYEHSLGQFQTPWQKTESVRQAVLHSARPPDNNPFTLEFGRGLLKANDMLCIAPPSPAPSTAANPLTQVRPDSVDFPLLQALLGITADRSESKALILETAQLIASSKELEDLLNRFQLEDWDAQDAPARYSALLTTAIKASFRDALKKHPHISKQLLRTL